MSVVRPTTAQLQARFKEWGYDVAQRPKGPQARLLCELVGVYQRAGILDWDEPRALCDVCPNAGPCWQGNAEAQRRGPDGDGSVLLP